MLSVLKIHNSKIEKILRGYKEKALIKKRADELGITIEAMKL